MTERIIPAGAIKINLPDLHTARQLFVRVVL